MVLNVNDLMNKLDQTLIPPKTDNLPEIRVEALVLIAKNLEEINYSLKILANHTKA